MYCFDSNQIVTYDFGKGLNFRGTLKDLIATAESLNVELDYIKLAKDNNIQNEYYESTSEGTINISDMHINHVRNALLKQLRLYFTRSNFEELSMNDFVQHLEHPEDYHSEINMLYRELMKRYENGEC